MTQYWSVEYVEQIMDESLINYIISQALKLLIELPKNNENSQPRKGGKMQRIMGNEKYDWIQKYCYYDTATLTLSSPLRM